MSQWAKEGKKCPLLGYHLLLMTTLQGKQKLPLHGKGKWSKGI